MASQAVPAQNRQQKIVHISGKRQITIPQKYFEKLGFGDEAECILRDNEIVLRPVMPRSDDFSDLILEDLLSQGYTGDELLAKFRETKKKIRPAVEALIADADAYARSGKGRVSPDKIFDKEE